MYLIPSPKSLVCNEGNFKLRRDTQIVLDAQCDFDDLNSAVDLQKEIENQLGFKLKLTKSFNSSNGNVIRIKKGQGSKESYELNIDNNGVVITGATGAGRFYGVQTLKQIVRQNGAVLQHVEIKDEPAFENRGFYHDVTRGKVPTLDTLKELVDRAAFYKLNEIQLYVEHSFAFTGMSEVWVDKDPLTAEEILLLDQYCREKHVDLVPSLSTFGHFYEILKSTSFNELCELENSEGTEYSFVDRMAHHTLNVSNEGSIKLVEKMLNEYIPLFSSEKFNICCDETFDLGRGKSKSLADEIGVGRLYTDFLNKVVNIVKAHDKKVMFWGDVILHHKELLGEIPEDVICLTWNYSADVNNHIVKVMAETGRPQYVCPGVAGWSMLMNAFNHSFENIKRMTLFGAEFGAIGMLNTDWGDYGHVNLLGNSMPGMIYGASLSWNPEGEKEFETVYRAVSAIEYGDKTEQVVPLLSKLSGAQVAGWSEAVRWKENHYSLEDIAKIDVERLVNGYNHACEMEAKLTEVAHGVTNNKFDMEEFIVSAQGIQLMNALFLAIIKYDCGKSETELIMDKNDLAEALEVWYNEYAEVWRTRNKESELYRIREVIMYACKKLRKW